MEDNIKIRIKEIGSKADSCEYLNDLKIQNCWGNLNFKSYKA